MSHARWHSALTLILTNPYSYHYPLSEKFLETRTMVTLIMGEGETQSSGRQLLAMSCLFRKTATVASPRGTMTSLAAGF